MFRSIQKLVAIQLSYYFPAGLKPSPGGTPASVSGLPHTDPPAGATVEDTLVFGFLGITVEAAPRVVAEVRVAGTATGAPAPERGLCSRTSGIPLRALLGSDNALSIDKMSSVELFVSSTLEALPPLVLGT